MRRIRCAIYTRKSTEEGLEQDFNSLNAQREACEAYIASQKHEGWEMLPDRFDDGGISGGHMERPALKELMQAIKDKRVDQIVVYKIDRLMRSSQRFAPESSTWRYNPPPSVCRPGGATFTNAAVSRLST
jgi:DNA invertase Pin-like site-specific DNA recombinase